MSIGLCTLKKAAAPDFWPAGTGSCGSVDRWVYQQMSIMQKQGQDQTPRRAGGRAPTSHPRGWWAGAADGAGKGRSPGSVPSTLQRMRLLVWRVPNPAPETSLRGHEAVWKFKHMAGEIHIQRKGLLRGLLVAPCTQDSGRTKRVQVFPSHIFAEHWCPQRSTASYVATARIKEHHLPTELGVGRPSGRDGPRRTLRPGGP
jgi:hypothetical protein